MLNSLLAGVISNWTDENRVPACTIFQAFKYYLDITTPPTPLLLQQFALLATSDKEKKRLQVLSKVKPQTSSSSRSWGQLQPQGIFIPHCGQAESLTATAGLFLAAFTATHPSFARGPVEYCLRHLTWKRSMLQLSPPSVPP